MELTRFDAKRLGHRAGYALDRQAPAPGNLLAGHPKLRLRKPLLATHHPAMALRVLVRLLECLAHQPPIPADRFPPPPAKHPEARDLHPATRGHYLGGTADRSTTGSP